MTTRRFARRHDRVATGITVVVGTALVLVPALAVVSELAVPTAGPPARAALPAGWLWTHVTLAAALLVVGVGVLARQVWALFAAIGVAISGLLNSFLAVPAHPAWSLLLIAVKVPEIWALSRELNTMTIRVTSQAPPAASPEPWRAGR